MIGKLIVVNICLINDTMHNTEIIQVPGVLMLIDFKKQLIYRSWNFIQDALHFFLNFGGPIKIWIYVFYNDIKSCVIQNIWSSI